MTIERGIWDGGAFRSTEGDWNTRHPGVPNWVAANAVRVHLLRTKSGLASRLFTFTPDKIAADSTATKGQASGTEVAPFAIPVCDILDRRAEYYGETDEREICHGDIAFGDSARHDTGSGFLRPGWSWQPCNESKYSSSRWDADFGRGYFASEDDFSTWLAGADSACRAATCPTCGQCPVWPVDTASSSGKYCFSVGGVTGAGYSYSFPTGFLNSGFFPMPSEFVQADGNGWRSGQDHFGVVGLPGLDATATQSTIRTQVESLLYSSLNPNTTTRLGDTFRILGSGLTTAELDSRIWQVISGIKDRDHTEIGLTELGTVDRNLGIFEAPIGFSASPSTPPSDWACDTLPCPPDPAMDAGSTAVWSMSLNHGLDGPEAGMCHSHWYNYDPATMRVGAERTMHFWPKWVARAELKKEADAKDDTPVWDAVVPVIADPGSDAASCNSPDQFHTPPPDPSREMMVIGFMHLYIYDVDIGQTPGPPEFTFPNGVKKTVQNWSFPAGQCNTVRGRLRCDRRFIPDSNVDSDYAAVHLIK